MPFKSKAQMRWMFATHPKMAKRWAHETSEIRGLPEHDNEDVRRHRKMHAKSLATNIRGKPKGKK